jgi:hypothetical protein
MTKARDIASAAPAPSTVSATELGYLDGVSSAIQTQIDGKQAANANVSTTELGYLDGVTSAIQTQLDAKIPKTLTTTTGDIIYASSANTPARLGIGSTSQVLTVSGGVPTWATPAGGGKILQVVQSTYSTEVTSSSGTFADTGLSASITPSSTSSKVLVFVYNNWEKSSANGDNGLKYKLVRGSTDIFTSYIFGYTSTTLRLLGTYSAQYLDSPSTTSSTTYKLQFNNFVNSSAVITQNGGSTAVMILMEVGA